jgi:hypothetical protein
MFGRDSAGAGLLQANERAPAAPTLVSKKRRRVIEGFMGFELR